MYPGILSALSPSLSLFSLTLTDDEVEEDERRCKLPKHWFTQALFGENKIEEQAEEHEVKENNGDNNNQNDGKINITSSSLSPKHYTTSLAELKISNRHSLYGAAVER
jgi:hypothetical protein